MQLNASSGFAMRPCDSAYPSLWQQMKFAMATPVAGGRNALDLSPSRFNGTPLGTSSSTLFGGMSPIGPCVGFLGNNALVWTAATWGLPVKFMTSSGSDKLTIQAYFKFTHSGSAKESTIFYSDVPTVGQPGRGYRLYVDNNADKLQLQIANTPDEVTTFPCVYKTSALTADKWYHAVFMFGEELHLFIYIGGTTCAAWIDGDMELPTISGTEQYCTHVTSRNARIGATLGSTAPDISVAQVTIWNRWLLERETQQLAIDPLAMFRRRRSLVGFAPLGRVTRNTRQTMNVRPGVGFQTMRGRN